MNKNLEELKELTERLTRKLDEIPSYKSCINSEVPNGRLWCSFYNTSLIRRCNKDCREYENKFLENVA